MKPIITGDGEGLGIASHIAHARTLEHNPIIIVGAEEEIGISINEGLPQLIQNIIESAENYSLTQYQELTPPLSGREKRRERRKQNRKNK